MSAARFLCLASALAQLASSSDEVVAAAVGSLRGTVADVASETNETNLLALLDGATTAFIEDGYTLRSGSADIIAAAASTSNDPGATAKSMGMGNMSNSIAAVDPAAMQTFAQSQSAYTLAATLYQHANFQGFHYEVHGDVASLGGAWNDVVSSLIIYPNWCVTIYEHVNFAGSWRRMCAGSSTWKVSYVGGEWNDRISSVQSSARR
jgi:hypothetical protein